MLSDEAMGAWEAFLGPMGRGELDSVARELSELAGTAADIADQVACEYVMFVSSAGTMVPPMPIGAGRWMRG